MSNKGWLLISVLMTGVFSSCQQQESEPVSHSETPAKNSETASDEITSVSATETGTIATEERPTSSDLPAINIFSDTPSQPGSSSSTTAQTAAEQMESVIDQLKPLQVLLGTWRGITRKEFGGFKAIDSSEWVWDFQTRPEQPALIVQSAESPYYRSARITYLPAEKMYQLQFVNKEGEQRILSGKYLEPIRDEPGDDGKPQTTYKLEFTEEPREEQDAYQWVINQQNNNRYLLEISRQRVGANRFIRYDTVSTQREGTSIAQIDEGYGEKTCIISGGLGTSTVSYKGQTYYVCCSGCRAAFNDDPEKWIARAKSME